MTKNPQEKKLQVFLKYQYYWATLLLLVWFGINTLILATNVIMEFKRAGKNIPLWEPFSWEISSALMILLLIPIGIFISDRWLNKQSVTLRLLLHALATIPFSAVHVAGMVGIRKLCYHLMGSQYNFGNLPVELFYEYRKDAQTYLTLSLVIMGYRLLVRRLHGEASYLPNGDVIEVKESELPPERLLIKKLGREFLIQTSDIEWVEASGNYANLHIKGSVYPMRITMDKLEKCLPTQFIRIHRSAIVNLKHVQEMQPLDTGDYQVTLCAGETLTLSRRYREAFKTLLSIN